MRRQILLAAMLCLGIGVAVVSAADGQDAEVLEQRGNRLSAAGNWQAAIDAWQASLAQRRDAGDRGGVARLTGTIAMAHFEHRDYAGAARHFAPFLELTRELHERRAEAVALAYLGNSYLYLYRYADASGQLREALAVARELRDVQAEGMVLSSLATAEFHGGFYVEAARHFEQLEKLGNVVGNRQWTAFAQLGLANVASSSGGGLRAMAAFQRALDSARSAGDRQVQGRALNGMGGVLLEQGDIPGAIDHFRRALELARLVADSEGEGSALGGLGTALAMTERRSDALQAMRQSLEVAARRGDRQAELDALVGIGLASERLGDSHAAIAAYQRALDYARQAGNRPGIVAALSNLAGAQLAAGSAAQGESSLQQAASLAAELRAQDFADLDRVRYFESQLAIYRQLRDLYVSRHASAPALEAAEQGRAQALRVQVARRLPQDARRSPLARDGTLRAARILAVAEQWHAAIIEYAVDEQRNTVVAWVVRPGLPIEMRETRLARPLAALVTEARTEMGVADIDGTLRSRGMRVVAAADRDAAPDGLRTLHKALIEPLADLLPADETMPLVIVPDRELNLVPFAALPDGDGRRLLDRHALLLAPSIDVMDIAGARPRSAQPIRPRDVLVVGNPTMPELLLAGASETVRLPPLPGTEVEARQVARLLGGRPLLAGAATRRQVIDSMSSARLIHLATHGLLDDLGKGIPGAIALAPSVGDDGLLSAADIAALNMHADLVVLSACDTGRGQLSGDGVVGLSRSLIAAGAASAVVSLWQVPDEPTAVLMTSFYEQLRRGADKPAALRTAMMETRRRFPDPYNWAAFVLFGDVHAIPPLAVAAPGAVPR